MVKHNNVIGNGHFKKDWQLRVKTWFNQPAQKNQRRQKRVAKAKQMAPRPLESLRPAVRCQTIKYNRKIRAGRGFTADELKVRFLFHSVLCARILLCQMYLFTRHPRLLRCVPFFA